jgi:diaminohydroxyphosphoribosylaminopyrimidine deaminase/5-amino-6-(5-phosphoribosylamino)uracil reductase
MPAKEGRVELRSLLRECGKRQITSLLVEGGGQVLGDFLENLLADDFHFFYAPKILGDPEAVPMVRGRPRNSISEAQAVYDLRVRRFGDDVMLSGRFHREIY